MSTRAYEYVQDLNRMEDIIIMNRHVRRDLYSRFNNLSSIYHAFICTSTLVSFPSILGIL